MRRSNVVGKLQGRNEPPSLRIYGRSSMLLELKLRERGAVIGGAFGPFVCVAVAEELKHDFTRCSSHTSGSVPQHVGQA
jgi:hypothetical protein